MINCQMNFSHSKNSKKREHLRLGHLPSLSSPHSTTFSEVNPFCPGADSPCGTLRWSGGHLAFHMGLLVLDMWSPLPSGEAVFQRNILQNIPNPGELFQYEWRVRSLASGEHATESSFEMWIYPLNGWNNPGAISGSRHAGSTGRGFRGPGPLWPFPGWGGVGRDPSGQPSPQPVTRDKGTSIRDSGWAVGAQACGSRASDRGTSEGRVWE